MLKEYCSFKGMQADMTMLDIPNRLDVLTGEMICIGPQGELPLGGHRNMIPDEYYGAAGENGRDPWVDPGKVFLGGLAQFAETEKKRREKEEIRKQRKREKKEDRLRRKLSRWLDRHMFRRWF